MTLPRNHALRGTEALPQHNALYGLVVLPKDHALYGAVALPQCHAVTLPQYHTLCGTVAQLISSATVPYTSYC